MTSAAYTLSTFEILNLYKSSVLKFMDSLIELFPDDSELIVMRVMFDGQVVPIEESLKRFANRLFTPVEVPPDGKTIPAEMIRKRNDKFFVSNMSIFAGVDSNKIVRWKQMWQSKRLDAEDRLAIWKWLDLFTEFARMYSENEKITYPQLLCD
jgi:hypothetical protein